MTNRMSRKANNQVTLTSDLEVTYAGLNKFRHTVIPARTVITVTPRDFGRTWVIEVPGDERIYFAPGQAIWTATS